VLQSHLSKLFVLPLSTALLLSAAEYYVSPTGTDSGDGSISKPLSLGKALGHGGVSSPARPGDTVWLRGGTYTGTYEVHVSGAPGKPIIFRQYPGERARLDSGSNPGYAINAMGDYIWFWGFEVFSSNTVRRSAESGSFPNDIKRAPEIGAMASSWGESHAKDVKFINMILHDGWNPFMAKEATNTEVYGSIFYHQGWEAPDGGHGHSLYAQNANSGTKRIEDNIMYGSFSHGLHLYTTGDYLYNFHIEGNVSFDNGALSALGGYTRNYLIGWGAAPKNIVFRNNYAYYSPRRSGGSALYFGSGDGCQNSSITGNYFATQNGAAIELQTSGGCAPTITGNTFFGKLTGMSSSSYPSNTYHTSRPTGLKVFIRPNRYEPGRANIIVYNWDQKSAVPVNLSGVLSSGDSYEILDAQNFFGPPVMSGKYYGGDVTISMQNTAVSPASGTVPVPYVHTTPEFGVFVVRRTSASSNTAPVVSAGTSQTITLPASATLNGSVSDDGQPANKLTIAWTRISGPGTVTFANAASPATTATFSAAGTYVLRLTADDSALSSSKDVSITVNAPTSSNKAPVVNAGADQTITLPNSATLNGTASDDGLPKNTLTTTWTKVSGPGNVTFANATSKSTTASFSAAGTYVLRLTASDSQLAKTDDVAITAASAGTAGPITIEAEAAARISPMSLVTMNGASAVTTTAANSGTVTFTANIPSSGTWVVWARILSADWNSDSFFVSANGDAEDVFDTAENNWSTAWQWRRVNGRGSAGTPEALNPRKFSLSAGKNTIKFRGRDTYTYLDKVIITNDLTYTPQ
jgi:hypothetical protein